jgi:hypothetical protein
LDLESGERVGVGGVRSGSPQIGSTVSQKRRRRIEQKEAKETKVWILSLVSRSVWGVSDQRRRQIGSTVSQKRRRRIEQKETKETKVWILSLVSRSVWRCQIRVAGRLVPPFFTEEEKMN